MHLVNVIENLFTANPLQLDIKYVVLALLVLLYMLLLNANVESKLRNVRVALE